MRRLIETHFSVVLMLAVAAGLFMPLAALPDDAASVALALLTYASCFKLRDGGFSAIVWRDVVRFYCLRYVLLPVALLMGARVVIPDYALGVFLLALVPAAVSSPAFSHMFGGHVPNAFAITILSTILAPFLIPLQYSWASDVAVTISPLGLFRTLSFCIFLPMVCYFFTRRLARWSGVMYRNITLVSIVLVAFVIALVIAKQRTVILADVAALWLPLCASLVAYGVFIAVGAWFGRRHSPEVRTTYMVCSGFNNVALGVSLALVHFPAPIILLVAVSEAAWALLPGVMQRVIRMLRA